MFQPEVDSHPVFPCLPVFFVAMDYICLRLSASTLTHVMDFVNDFQIAYNKYHSMLWAEKLEYSFIDSSLYCPKHSTQFTVSNGWVHDGDLDLSQI